MTYNKKGTIGYRVDKKAKIYRKLYNNFLKDEDSKISSKAKELALHDLILDKFVAEQVLEKIEQYIERKEVRQK